MCPGWTLKKLVGANGFEPSTSWSRTRFHALLQSTEFCGLEAIDNEPFAACVWKSIEAFGREVLPQLQNHLRCAAAAVWRPSRLRDERELFGLAQLKVLLCLVCPEANVSKPNSQGSRQSASPEGP